MLRKSRLTGGASLILMSLFLGATGCLNTAGSDRMFLSQQTYPSQPQSHVAAYPNGVQNPQAIRASGPIQQASHMAPRAMFTGQPMPPQTDEPMTDQPQFVMPPHGGMVVPTSPPLPTEKAMVSHPPHRVAPPDILLIEALRLVPKGPYKLAPMEVLQIEVTDTLPREDIKGLFMITPDGFINLGHSYGAVRVGGMTIDQAQAAIRTHLQPRIQKPGVNITLVQMRGMQNIKGEHLVRPDGTISLGMYGSVYVAGMTLGQVKCVIENHLAAYLVEPQISVDVFAYNSRKIYIIADGAGYGQQVIALPATGGETVLDAISRVQGLPQVASLKKIWVARPSPAGHPCSQVLPVDWKAITQAGRTETNYQLLPGDRIYIHSDALIALYNYVDKIVAPVERVLGVMFLGASTVQAFRGNTNAGFVVAP